MPTPGNTMVRAVYALPPAEQMPGPLEAAPLLAWSGWSKWSKHFQRLVIQAHGGLHPRARAPPCVNL